MFTEEIKKISSDILDKIILIRRKLHRNPELGFKEFETSSFIADHFKKLGIPVIENLAQTGLSALLEFKKPGKTIAIRADMDALPIEEMNTFDYVSGTKGIMHACGHDAHMAIALGAAEILSHFKNELHGNVKFIFQPGEEGLGGAKEMIDEGVLRNPKVSAIIATHVSPLLHTGKIALRPGPIMASPSDFEIIINGKSGHAAEPHTAIDPIVIGANLINLFQNIVTREKSPFKNAIISVTCFNAGSSNNIIPDTAVLKGTVRTFDHELDNFIAKRMEEITAAVTSAMGAKYDFSYKVSYPPVINDETMFNVLAESASKVIPQEDVITDMDPLMLAEDFSYYVQRVPGVIFHLGCREPNSESINNLHSSSFNLDESCIKIGMEIMAQCAIDYLNR